MGLCWVNCRFVVGLGWDRSGVQRRPGGGVHSLTLMPGCTWVAPGTYLVWGSNMTRCSPDTKLGRSVKWYTALQKDGERKKGFT